MMQTLFSINAVNNSHSNEIIMAKEYIYTYSKSGKVLFRSIEPNYISKEIVDQKVKDKTGQDPRLNRHLIECTIRAIGELPPTTCNYDRNKKLENPTKRT